MPPFSTRFGSILDFCQQRLGSRLELLGVWEREIDVLIGRQPGEFLGADLLLPVDGFENDLAGAMPHFINLRAWWEDAQLLLGIPAHHRTQRAFAKITKPRDLHRRTATAANGCSDGIEALREAHRPLDLRRQLVSLIAHRRTHEVKMTGDHFEIEEVRGELHDHPLLRRLLLGRDFTKLSHLFHQRLTCGLDVVEAVLIALGLRRKAELGDRGGVVHLEQRHGFRDVRAEPAHQQPFHRIELHRLATVLRDRLLRRGIDERLTIAHLSVVRQPDAAAGAKAQEPVAGEVLQRLDATGFQDGQ